MIFFHVQFLTNSNLLEMQFHTRFINRSKSMPDIFIPYVFNKLNLAFRCVLFKVGFLTKLHPFSVFSQRRHLVLPNHNKLEKSHSFIHLLLCSLTLTEIFLSWSVFISSYSEISIWNTLLWNWLINSYCLETVRQQHKHLNVHMKL